MMRDIVRPGGPPRWTESTALGDFRLTVTHPASLDGGRSLPGLAGRLGCYDLGPGHARSGVRTRQTLEWARGYRFESAADEPSSAP